MRKFRTAAVAAATAFSLTLAGTGVAAADDTEAQANETTTSLSSFSNSSQKGKEQGAWTEGEDGKPVIETENQVLGIDLLGSSTADNNPEWAENWKNIATVGVIGSIVGAIIGGINWLKFQGILPY